MNAKWLEIAEEAGFGTAWTKYEFGNLKYTLLRIYTELIIKECTENILLELRDEYLRQERPAQEEVFLIAAVDDSISAIKTYFGIE